MSKSTLKRFSIGLDYGTSSVRALIVDVQDGSELASAVFDYPSGVDGVLIDPKNPLVARQNPNDYVQGFYETVSKAVISAKKQGFDPNLLAGIGIDTTGSTPIPVDAEGMPLGMNPKYEKDLAAQAWLWKDHTGHAEAAAITNVASKHSEKYLRKCGGTYSSEWIWSKAWRCKMENPQVFAAAYSWVELADFVPGFITGNMKPETMARGICAAGHKAMYNEDWGGLPSEAFLKKLDPDLLHIRNHYSNRVVPSDQKAGDLTAEIAAKVGLPAGIPVAVGAFDCHMGAVGAGIKPGTLVKIIGTSTCDIMIHPISEPLANIPGLCGIVPGSVIPGFYGLEAGQSAVGDIFNWFVKNLAPAEYTANGSGAAHVLLSEAAAKLAPGESGLLALDWNNGNRTILVDQLLTGLLIGQTLHTTAAEIYRALIEATAFGAFTIIKRFEEYGVPVKDVVNSGGIAEKNPLLMQIYADVCNRPMRVCKSSQTCALGAAIFGAVVGGAHKDTIAAQRKMSAGEAAVYKPNKKAVAVYEKLYGLYRQLHDSFGTPKQKDAMFSVMKDLIKIRERM